jgi:hypothetical protein
MPTSRLATLLPDWHLLLQGWAADGRLSAAAQEALLLGGEPDRLTELVSQWAGGDFSALPSITLLAASSMPGAAGAYAISTGTIYINQDWLLRASRERALAVLTEELGHHLDGLLNSKDTPGDEGAIFAAALHMRGLPVTSQDHGPISDDNARRLDAEFSRESKVDVFTYGSPGVTEGVRGLFFDGDKSLILNAFRVIDGNSPTFKSESILVKLGLNGQAVWELKVGSTWHASPKTYVNSMSQDRDGNLYITGRTDNYFEDQKLVRTYRNGQAIGLSELAFIAKASKDGKYIWKSFLYPKDLLYFRSTGTAINVNQINGDIFIAGYAEEVGAASTFLAKYNRDGVRAWMRYIPVQDGLSRGTYYDEVARLLDGPNGSIAVAEKVNYNARISKYDTNGNLIWQSQGLGLDAEKDQILDAIALTNANGYIVLGSENENNYLAGKKSIFLSRVTASGEIAWKKSITPISTKDGLELWDIAGGKILEDEDGELSIALSHYFGKYTPYGNKKQFVEYRPLHRFQRISQKATAIPPPSPSASPALAISPPKALPVGPSPALATTPPMRPISPMDVSLPALFASSLARAHATSPSVLLVTQPLSPTSNSPFPFPTQPALPSILRSPRRSAPSAMTMLRRCPHWPLPPPMPTSPRASVATHPSPSP